MNIKKKKKKEQIFPNPKPTLIHSFFEGLALIPALYLHSEERLLLEFVLWIGLKKASLLFPNLEKKKAALE